MKANCLTRALDQWSEDKDFRLWYNSNHVISLEPEYEASDLSMTASWKLKYLPLEDFGADHLISSFRLKQKYSDLLIDYLNEV